MAPLYCRRCHADSVSHPIPIPATAQCYPYRPHPLSHQKSSSAWESKSFKHGSYPIARDYREPRSDLRDHYQDCRYHGDTQISICQFCQRRYCRCPRSELERRGAVSTRDSCSRDDSCRCRPTKSQSRQDELQHGTKLGQIRRVQFFESKKNNKEYEDARDIFQEAMACDESRPISDEMLRLKSSYADMLVIQGKCEEAEEIISDVLRWNDLPSTLEKQCKAIYGKILCSRKRYKEAEAWYRKLYDRTSQDAWSLDMGDRLCEVIASQGDYDLARLEQVKLWEKRKKSLGQGHPSTIKSAITAVDHLKKLVQQIPTRGVPDGDHAKQCRQNYEADIEHILKDLWTSIESGPRKQEASMLKAGHELGTSFCRHRKYTEAEKILAEVWQGRNAKLGGLDKDTVSTGISLSEAMYGQGIPEKFRAAVTILEAIEALGTAQFCEEGDSIAAAARAHLAVVYSRLGEYAKAESFCRRSMNMVIPKGGVSTPPPELLRYALGRALIGQGGNKALEGQQVVAEVNHGLQLTQQKAGDMLNGRRLLTGTSLPWGSTSDQLTNAQEAFRSHKDILARTGWKDIEFYRTGLHYGSLLLQSRDLEWAQTVLGQLWNQKTKVVVEDGLRAQCGDLYGLCLSMQGHDRRAKEVLYAVRDLKKKLYPGTANQERRNTGDLIRAIPDGGFERKPSNLIKVPSLWSMMIS